VVDAATVLFDERGFHATAMDDVGAAAGISGPGLYRHVASKDDLLIAVFDRIWTRLRPAVDDAAGRPPAEALRRLVAAHSAMVLGDPAALRLLLRELRNVPDDYQRLAARNHGRYVAAWTGPLRDLRDIDDDTARTLVLAAHGSLDASAVHVVTEGVPTPDADLLAEATLRLLGV
jgi:AcrR family transcriptional regulator